jgi:hypothetical protein
LGLERIARTFILALVMALMTACGESPAGPSQVTEGVVIFADPRFRGPSMSLSADVADLDDLTGGCLNGSNVNFDDCISSIRIPAGWSVTFYEDPRFRGQSVTITSDVADLEDTLGPCDGDFDDCISSIRVSPP